MPCVVITGGPGAGKTTLLTELGRRGFATVAESARALIAERLAAGQGPRPDPWDFAVEIRRRDIENYERHRGDAGWTFFDRGVLEAVAMVHKARPLPAAELQALVRRSPFHPQVVVLPPWPEIYVTDAERDQGYDDAVRVHAAIVDWYAGLGYRIITLPPGPVAWRADQVLGALGDGAGEPGIMRRDRGT